MIDQHSEPNQPILQVSQINILNVGHVSMNLNHPNFAVKVPVDVLVPNSAKTSAGTISRGRFSSTNSRKTAIARP